MFAFKNTRKSDFFSRCKVVGVDNLPKAKPWSAGRSSVYAAMFGSFGIWEIDQQRQPIPVPRSAIPCRATKQVAFRFENSHFLRQDVDQLLSSLLEGRPDETLRGDTWLQKASMGVGLSLWLNPLCRGWYGNAEFKFYQGKCCCTSGRLLSFNVDVLVICTSFTCYVIYVIESYDSMYTYLFTYMYIYIYIYIHVYHIWAPIFQVSQLWYQKSRLFVTDVTSAGHCSLWVESSTRSRTRGTGCSGTVLPLVVWGIMKSPVFIGIPWNH